MVNRRVRVYWPLDQSWYEGCVRSFDKITGKHLVQYDDAEEECLDIDKEKIEWVEEPVKRFRRLRRASVVEDEDEVVENVEDDSADEDWGKNAEKEEVDGESEDMDLVDEEDDDDAVETVKRTPAKKSESRKRKTSVFDKLGSNKKSKIGGYASKSAGKVSLDVSGRKLMEPTVNNGNM